MSKYSSDRYLVFLFDRMGTKTKTEEAASFLDAQDVGRVAVSQGMAHSFSVARVLYNSLEPHTDRYDVRGKQNA